MGRNCMVCGRLFGCIRGKVRYVCADCRLQDGCGIRNHFSSTRLSREICEACLSGQEHEEACSTLNLKPLLKRGEVFDLSPWS